MNSENHLQINEHAELITSPIIKSVKNIFPKDTTSKETATILLEAISNCRMDALLELLFYENGLYYFMIEIG